MFSLESRINKVYNPFGDFNAHIGAHNEAWKCVIGGHVAGLYVLKKRFFLAGLFERFFFTD